MKALLFSLAFICSFAFAKTSQTNVECKDCEDPQLKAAERWETQWLQIRNELIDGGPVEVKGIRSEKPTTVMMGYSPEDKACYLLLNLSQNLNVSPIDMMLSMAHEAGHCVALRSGFQQIEQGEVRDGEAFADVWALAWIKANSSHVEFLAAYERLIETRYQSRAISRTHDTLIAVRMAGEKLKETRDHVNPSVFTHEFMRSMK